MLRSADLSGKRVVVTGATGFLGGYVLDELLAANATIIAVADRSRTARRPEHPARSIETIRFDRPDAARIGSRVEDIRGDIRDAAHLDSAMKSFAPEVVFHLAAQPLVRLSYDDPIITYETNVIGTARVLDSVRRTPSVRAVVSVTTDKCYENKEWVWGYRETDPLGGYDPYSSSKACAEIVSAAFRQSYFPVDKIADHRVAIATARAGNVIGGGDWSLDRLLPRPRPGFSLRQARPHPSPTRNTSLAASA